MVVKKITDSIVDLLSFPHIGVDEAGRGCLAGPVVAAAVIFPDDIDIEKQLPGLTDSKQLSEKNRDRLTPLIMKSAISYGLGLSWPLEIDSYNIVVANYRAMTRAVFQLAKKAYYAGYPFLSNLPLLLIDGNLPIQKAQWQSKEVVSDFYPLDLPGGISLESTHVTNRSCFSSENLSSANKNFLVVPQDMIHSFFASSPPQAAIIKGDQRVPAIAAASILAKTKRDFIMKQLDKFYPEYNFSKHKGYATKSHYEALDYYSFCSLHRSSFLKNFMNKTQQLSLFE